jgi:cytoskeletal protein CcmA (bactofilin family)
MISVVINGKKFSVGSFIKSLSAKEGVVIINGKQIFDGKECPEINIEVQGDCGDIDAAGSVIVKGNVNGDIDASGQVEVNGDVKGNIDANGSVDCGNVGGDVDANGSVSMRK